MWGWIVFGVVFFVFYKYGKKGDKKEYDNRKQQEHLPTTTSTQSYSSHDKLNRDLSEVDRKIRLAINKNEMDAAWGLLDNKSRILAEALSSRAISYKEFLSLDAENYYHSAIFLSYEGRDEGAFQYMCWYAFLSGKVLEDKTVLLLKKYFDKANFVNLYFEQVMSFLAKLPRTHNSFSDVSNFLRNYIPEYWADEIKQYKNEPLKRLGLAYQNLPLSVAFKEAKIAVRALIREKRKYKTDYEAELEILYGLAVFESMAIPYSTYADTPGYNIMNLVWKNTNEFTDLTYDYQQVGYKKLRLGVTDIKWIVAKWGEPQTHSTLNKVHHDIWCYYEREFVKRRNDFCANFGVVKY
ncbi:hypothetical protein [Phocoenobacter skyensis]|uniref:Uncharacterized protein n=1 Tax=Phocoenobacter skyensis TaxID=97481 RepID=A0A1H8A7F6_9PAST|nr:hypothetical protein [Pasteurella skyensis]QLB23317.1 hypothetical protein A6B44_08905 [Pasteurella skyensis]SEM65719.1 hypothetical protein SAMN05444853_13714 [Pasteurella skyensis]